MNKRKPPMRKKSGIDRGQNSIYNNIYKAFLITVAVRNDELVEWVKEAQLPYTKSLMAGWRQNPDAGKRYRLMRLEELSIMTELVRRKRKGESVEGLHEQVKVKGYFKPEEAPPADWSSLKGRSE